MSFSAMCRDPSHGLSANVSALVVLVIATQDSLQDEGAEN